jgi:hypothetical protein
MQIPKRISFFWGGGPLSWMRWMTFYSFRLLNPDWEMVLYLAPTCQNKATWHTGERQDCEPPLACEDRLPMLAPLKVRIEPWHPPAEFAAASPVHMADLCRWGVLAEFGGWFADTDILFVDSMELLEKRHQEETKGEPADVALPLCRDWIPTGIMGAVRRTRFAADMYSLARGRPDFTRHCSLGGELLARVCGVDPILPKEWRVVARRLRTAFPGTAFWFAHHLTAYRWEWHAAHEIFDRDEEVLPDCVGIHWYAGSRVGSKFNRLLTEKNFREHKNTFCHYAANLLDGSST